MVTRWLLGNAHDEGLRVDGRRRLRFWEREKTRRTQIHVPAVEDRYIMLCSDPGKYPILVYVIVRFLVVITSSSWHKSPCMLS
jgi:hypothetical protein